MTEKRLNSQPSHADHSSLCSEQVIDSLGVQLFVGGLPPSAVEEHIEAFFGLFGPLMECRLMRYRDGKSRGFGFVTFVHAVDAERAMSQPYPSIMGKFVEIKQALSQDASRAHNSDQIAKKIYVGNFSAAVSEKTLKNYFEQFGQVTGVKIIYDIKTNESRGFGFIIFGEVESAQAACSADGHYLCGSVLECRPAISKIQFEEACAMQSAAQKMAELAVEKLVSQASESCAPAGCGGLGFLQLESGETRLPSDQYEETTPKPVPHSKRSSKIKMVIRAANEALLKYEPPEYVFRVNRAFGSKACANFDHKVKSAASSPSGLLRPHQQSAKGNLRHSHSNNVKW